MSDADAPKGSSELRVRVLAGVAMIAVAVVALWGGGYLLWLLCALAALAMTVEWCGLHAASGRVKAIALVAVAVALFAALPLVPERFAIGLAVTLAAAAGVLALTRRLPLALGIAYVVLPVLSLLFLRHQKEGIVFALWALALVWATDIGAYFVGRAIGGPKLAPRLSPKKTWAGLIGGVVAASLWGAFLHWYAGLPLRLTLATPLLAVAAQAGDLYESWLKRRAGVKDSGDLLPGHGGVLDRLDGLVPVAPLAALLVVAPVLYR